jgi:hypothetical protein
MDISNKEVVYKKNGYSHSPNLNRQRIIRTLLNNPQGNLTKYKVAKLSECKFPTTHRILKELEKQGLIDGTKVNDFRSLIMWWKKWQVKPRERWYLVKDPVNLLIKSKLQYAVTTYQAENRVQNNLFATITDFYIRSKDVLLWHRKLLENGLVGKGNVRLLVGDEHVFYNSFVSNQLNLVSLPQLIVDLLNEGGSCVEAANQLIQKVIDDSLPRL